MKTINEQRDEIMLAVKRAVADNSVTYEPDSDYCMFSCDDIDHEEVADNLIGESALLIWKHLSQFGEGTSFYVFCRRYVDLKFKQMYKEWKIRRAHEKALSDLYRTGVLC